MRIGIDVGGTFTDVVLLDDAGRAVAAKVATTPLAPVEGALAGVREALELAHASASDVTFVGHGTTIATNLMVEGRGARTALLTTRGFRDVLEIRRASRHDRADLYDLFFTNPAPLVPRALRFEVDERIGYDASIERPLNPASVDAVIDAAAAAEVEAIAICLLNSPVAPQHEAELLRRVRERLPSVFTCASFDVNPELYEYERTSTTVINAMLGPKCAGYIRAFVGGLESLGCRGTVLFMRSNGGLATARLTSDLPVTLLESGPAGGVTAAAKLCGRIGLPNVICGDMGGTTFDVSLVRDGRAEIRSGGHVHTHAVRAPTIDIESIGAGGGSIAWVDEGGGLHVGPRSAGADPGPACYGRGGTRPTVTDCNLVLGFVDPDSFLGGSFRLDVAAARSAIDAHLARPLGQSVDEAAATVRAIANALMAQAIRLITVERGYDPRDFAYLCYGGGGPVHAVDLASELGIPTVVVPRLPGLFSAFGMLVADQLYDTQVPVSRDLDGLTPDEFAANVAQVDVALREQLQRGGIDAGSVRVERRADCRYSGQADTLSVPLASGVAEPIAALRAGFEAVHRRQWNFLQTDRPISLVNLRAQAIVPTAQPPVPPSPARSGSAPTAYRIRRVAVEGVFAELPVYRRDDLRVGDELPGPALVEEPSSCLVFRIGDVCRADSEGNLIVKLRENTQ